MIKQGLALVAAVLFSGCATASRTVSREDFEKGNGRFCFGHCPFRVTVFMDESAKRDLVKYNLTPEQILRNVYKKYWEENRIDLVGYDYKNLAVKEWRHTESFIPFRKFLSFSDDFFGDKITDLFFEEIMPIEEVEWRSEIWIFLTGDLSLGTGCAPSGFGGPGTGTLIIGTAEPEDLWSDKKSLQEVFGEYSEKDVKRYTAFYNLDQLSKLTIIVMHEQGHLYGLKHVNDENSFMYPWTNKNFKLDEKSKQKLERTLNKLNN